MSEKEKTVGVSKKEPKKYDNGKGADTKKVDKPKKDEKFSTDQKKNQALKKKPK